MHLPQKILHKQKQEGIEIKFVKQPAVEDVERARHTSDDAESLGRCHGCFHPRRCSTKLVMDQIDEPLCNDFLQDFRQTPSRQKQR
jgi:hypothetical protein